MQSSNGTIAFIATPLGEGGIGVVQVMGPQSLEMAGKLFRSKKQIDLTKAPNGGLFYGTINDNEGLIDEVLVSVWRANESVENLVEINCHGGIMAVRKTLEALLKIGAREGKWEELLDRIALYADLGERQERAVPFPTKKEGLDLIQKEALLLLPRARTKLAVRMLLSQYLSSTGGLSQEVKRLEEMVKGFKIGLMNCDSSVGARCNVPLLSNLETLVNSSSFGLPLTNPLKVTIAGAPNVGKSTLFNALLREDRALVHHEPGTTRDYVTEFISIEGIPFELIDTAGLRDAEGVEKLGVELATILHQEADKIILVLDASRPITQEEEGLVGTLDTRKVIPVLNKIDVVGTGLQPCPRWTDLKVCPYVQPPCEVSALEGKGLDGLKRMLIKDFLPELEKGPHRPIVFTQRQRGLLMEALNVAKEIPESVCDCFTASDVLEKLDDLERLFHTLLKA